jgi:hypothetical protein
MLICGHGTNIVDMGNHKYLLIFICIGRSMEKLKQKPEK